KAGSARNRRDTTANSGRAPEKSRVFIPSPPEIPKGCRSDPNPRTPSCGPLTTRLADSTLADVSGQGTIAGGRSEACRPNGQQARGPPSESYRDSARPARWLEPRLACSIPPARESVRPHVLPRQQKHRAKFNVLERGSPFRSHRAPPCPRS